MKKHPAQRHEAEPRKIRPASAQTKPTQTAKADSQPLAERIAALLGRPGYQPLDKVGLSKAIGLHSSERRKLHEALAALEHHGRIVRIRKERYVLPETAQLITGRIEFHRNGTAHLISEDAAQADVFISAENASVALHGDRVVARLLSERERHRAAPARGHRQEGRIIRVLDRATTRIVGTLQRSPRFHYVVPDDPRLGQDIYVEPTPTAAIGDKVVVRFDDWTSRHVNPEGTIVEVLGRAGAPGVDMLSIMKKHDLPERFPDAVLREADEMSEQISEAEIASRVDCRALPIVTIDPDDAKDFDDAIYVEETASGWSLQVHIADVSHYVRPGSALDREARLRGNSTYLADRVVPMLPERLSNGLCSLKPQVERLTYAAFIEFDRKGTVTHTRFAKAVIRSSARHTYKQAFALLQGPAEADPRLHTAWKLAALLRKNRFAAGSLDLDFPEVKVWLDEQGRATRLERIENDISHQLIEEFMLAANEAVAKSLKHRKVPAVYRIHEKPDADRLMEFREIAGTHGYRMGNPELRGELQRLLRSIRGKPEEHAIKMALLRRLKRAAYDTQPVGHFGLAKVHYTHFTSPIRRYADLLVHRALDSAAKIGKRDGRPMPMGELRQITEHISKTERTSADAEFESRQIKKLEFFRRQLDTRRPQEFNAVVSDVRSFGLIVELPDAMQSGVVPVSLLGDDFFVFDSVRQCFFSRRNRKRFGLGDRLKVIVARVDNFKRQIDFAAV
jgi:ribonuclease R